MGLASSTQTRGLSARTALLRPPCIASPFPPPWVLRLAGDVIRRRVFGGRLPDFAKPVASAVAHESTPVAKRTWLGGYGTVQQSKEG